MEKHWLSKSVWAVSLALVGAAAGPGLGVTVVCVDASATGSDNGGCWDDAYLDLQDALAHQDVDEIWVAAGTYTPGTSRSDSFALVDGVGVYGGFAGDETLLSQRDIEANETILSGEIGSGSPTDNCHHVVKASSGVSSSARLDGFTVTKGAKEGSGDTANGAGIFIDDGDPKIVNCLITDNTAINGGGIYVTGGGDPVVENCVVRDNVAQAGAGIYNDKGQSTITNCTIYDNDARKNATWSTGGGIYVTDAASGDLPVIRNCILSQNTETKPKPLPLTVDSGETAQVFYAGSTTDIKYCFIDWCSTGSGGYCETPGDGNIGVGVPPIIRFTDAPDDLTLACDSPAIDAGDNSAVTQSSDRAHGTRKVDAGWIDDTGSGTGALVDMGAYEIQAALSTIYVDLDATGAGNGTSWTHAFTDLQDGLVCADDGSEVWVAEGTYYPQESCVTSGCDRLATFKLRKGATLYGGFDGTETTVASRAHLTCNGGTNDGNPCESDGDCPPSGSCVITILSGDIDRNDTIVQASCTDADSEWNSTDGYCERIRLQSSLTQYSCEPVFGGTWISASSKCRFNLVAEFTDDDYNSYHVVVADLISSNATLDGFTVTAGNANKTGICSTTTTTLCDVDGDCPGSETCIPLHNQGPGLHNRNQTTVHAVIDNDLTVRNCIFTGNVADNHGALNDHGEDTVITNCTFDRNFSAGKAGGLYMHIDAVGTVTDCTFTHNAALNLGGGMWISAAASGTGATVTGCTFSNNLEFSAGGAGLWIDGGEPTIEDCRFFGNVSPCEGCDGAAIYPFELATVTIDACVFVGNVSGLYGGAVAYASNNSTGAGVIKNSVFVHNTAGLGGGVAVLSTEAPDIEHSVFVGNQTHNVNIFDDGAAIYFAHGVTHVPTISNTLIAGNFSVGSGTAFFADGSADPETKFINCTVADNYSYNGYAFIGAGGITLINSIVQRNLDYYGDEHSFSGFTVDRHTVSYSNLGSWDGNETATCGGGDTDCLDANSGTCDAGFFEGDDCECDDDCDAPEATINESGDNSFVTATTGTWVAADTASFDADLYQTSLTDVSQSWTTDEHVGKVFRGNTDNRNQTYIVANDADTITVWGDVEDDLVTGKTYEILDYHLVSTSSSIDAGDNDHSTNGTDPGDLDGEDREVDGDDNGTCSEVVDFGAYEAPASDDCS